MAGLAASAILGIWLAVNYAAVRAVGRRRGLPVDEDHHDRILGAAREDWQRPETPWERELRERGLQEILRRGAGNADHSATADSPESSHDPNGMD